MGCTCSRMGAMEIPVKYESVPLMEVKTEPTDDTVPVLVKLQEPEILEFRASDAGGVGLTDSEVSESLSEPIKFASTSDDSM